MNNSYAEMKAEAVAEIVGAELCGSRSVGSLPQGALSPKNYAGGFEPRDVNAVYGGQATYDGTLAATLLERALVLPILPAEARLATPAHTSCTLHPVLWLMGRQNEPRFLNKGKLQPIPGAKPYNELILLVPYTVHYLNDRWHSYAARMYLDDIGATLIGNLAYAYAKLLGTFVLTPTSAAVRSGSSTVFEIESDVGADPDDATVGAAGQWLSDTQAQLQWPGYLDIRTILEMPIIGHSTLLGYRRSYFEWGYDSALVARTGCVVRVKQELRPGMWPWVKRGYLPSAPQATFKVRNVRWRLSTRFPSQRFGG